MSNNVNITAGSGVIVSTEQITADSSQCQIFKLAVSADNDRTKIPATAANGVTVDVTRVQGTVTVVQGTPGSLKVDASGVAVPITDNSGSLTVDAPVGTPAFVRLSDGTNPIATLPVSGTTTANQGTAGSAAAAWFAKISDGTDIVGITTVGGAKALKVDVVQSVASSASAADSASFTAGTTPAMLSAGVYNDSATDPSSGQLAAVKITQKRAFHVNLRAVAGTEIGTSGAPVRTDPTGTTPQPVTQSGTWALGVNKIGTDAIAKVGTGVQVVALADSAGSSITAANAVPTTRRGESETRVTVSVAFTASQTAQTVWDPGSGKKFYIRKITLVVTTAGPLELFQESGDDVFNSGAANFPTGVYNFDFDHPWASSTATKLLQYTSGSGLVGHIVINGYVV